MPLWDNLVLPNLPQYNGFPNESTLSDAGVGKVIIEMALAIPGSGFAELLVTFTQDI